MKTYGIGEWIRFLVGPTSTIGKIVGVRRGLFGIGSPAGYRVKNKLMTFEDVNPADVIGSIVVDEMAGKIIRDVEDPGEDAE